MRNTGLLSLFSLLTAFTLGVSATAQTQVNETTITRIAPGQKQKVRGVIVSLAVDKLVIRDTNGSNMEVSVTSATKIVKKKANPSNALLPGLEVTVEGRGDNSGWLVAEKIKYTKGDFRVARSLDIRVGPIETRVTTTEGRLGTAENRITAAELNAQRLEGQIEELSTVANTARGGAKAAQETADQALAAAKAASADIQATNDRISQIDNYEARRNVAVNFRVNTAVLSDEAKATLDEIAAQAKNEKGYLIQVTGYASADGTDAANRTLSRRRAESVKRYLAEAHDIPLFRIITPFGFGEAKPVADNSTRVGRKQNRRVEVTILVNKGLTASGAASPPIGL
jgi:OmpA-OmpF porin, OOP family